MKKKYLKSLLVLLLLGIATVSYAEQGNASRIYVTSCGKIIMTIGEEITEIPKEKGGWTEEQYKEYLKWVDEINCDPKPETIQEKP